MDYKNLMKKELEHKLKNEISILDGNHCSLLETSYTITQSYICDDNSFYFKITPILGENINILGYFNNVSINLDTNDGSSLFYLENNDLNNEIIIYRNKQQNDTIATIKPIKYGVYRVEFLNLEKEEYEYFEMVSDKKLQICDIFYGDEKKVVGKIKRRNRNNNFEVELAPSIDYIFMLGIASFFFCEDLYNDDDLKRNSDDVSLLKRLSLPIKKLSMINFDKKDEKEQNSKCYLRHCNYNDCCSHTKNNLNYKKFSSGCCRCIKNTHKYSIRKCT